MPKKKRQLLAEQLWDIKKDLWERLRRNTQYRNDYEQYRKLSSQKSPAARKRIAKLVKEFHQRYRLECDGLPSPSRKFSSKIYEIVALAYMKLSCKKDYTPIRNKYFERRSRAGKKIKLTKNEILTDGEYIDLRVNINLPFEMAGFVVSQTFKRLKKILSQDDTFRPAQVRRHFSDNEIAYRVWDLKESGRTYKEIGKRIWKSKDEPSSIARAEQHYKKAKRLIESAVIR